MDYTKCWLQYNKLSEDNTSEIVLYHQEAGVVIDSAIAELTHGLEGYYGRKLVITTDKAIYEKAPTGIYFTIDKDLGKEAYEITCVQGKCKIIGGDKNGLLYGIFALLRNLSVQQIKEFNSWSYQEDGKPSNPLRMLNHWDNMDGSIERGYSGNSFFFDNEEILINQRIKDYARMVASIGINGVVINNVNVKDAATELISKRYYDKVRKLAQIFESYGIKLFLSINFAAPMELGGVDTADPCDNKVITWWKTKTKEVYENVPELGGYLVKADSEGRPGPFTYDRTHADGANMLAEALLPFQGIVIWRCFVYNCKQDWRDKKTDRARAGYDHFMPLDGKFADNVILQIKNGPMDFQVREPISPLFGGLEKTNMMLEVQIAQEYTGQQRHVCYLIPWFKEILEFDLHCDQEKSVLKDVISGGTYHNKNCGMVAVTNTGNDENWTGHDLAAANLYGFGRLSFKTDLAAEEIAREWIIMTFGATPKVLDNLMKILMKSWLVYEKYTAPLALAGW